MIAMKKLGLAVSLAMATSQLMAAGTTHTTVISPLNYGGSTGIIKFNDWGYTGPRGASVNDFSVPGSGGFDANNMGQKQTVVSLVPDWKTSDPPQNIMGDNIVTTYTNASMDGQTNLFQFAFTTPAGSKFIDMEIDRKGNYHVPKANMQWGFYGEFLYHDESGANPDQAVTTNISFQPYPLSDALGWCGSTMISDPNGVQKMAGQVTFDFAFDGYIGGVGPSTQIVPGFVMRSYGDYEVKVKTLTGILQHFVGHAVGNNTNPESVQAGVGGVLDPNFNNRVSFLGAGVVPNGVWVLNDFTRDVTVVPQGTPGATWHQNTFAGYAFMLRADGSRTLTYINPIGHSEYVSTNCPTCP